MTLHMKNLTVSLNNHQSIHGQSAMFLSVVSSSVQLHDQPVTSQQGADTSSVAGQDGSVGLCGQEKPEEAQVSLA